MPVQPKFSPENIREDVIRLEHLETLKKTGVEPYPARSRRTHTLASAKSAAAGSKVVVAGRLISRRDMGKITFGHLTDASGNLQIVFSLEKLGQEKFAFVNTAIDIGDFLNIEGEMFATKKGEISVLVKRCVLLAKTLLPLPEKWHGLTDVETRYRQRYLDLLANEESMRIAKVRSVLVKELRNYFDARGFYEVETPILQALYGGANAKPFVTHHNALDIPLYLRIAPELYLKRLVVGGFEKVYEIAKCFRNEGIDQNHNPEFTQIEFYQAYADYTTLMDLMEDLLPKLLKVAGVPLAFTVEGQKVNFTPPYPRQTMRAIIKEYAKLDIEAFPDQVSLFKAAKKMKTAGIEPGSGRGKLIDDIYKHFVRPRIVNPLFMIDHPVELSPLSKRKAEDPRYVERFQLLCVGGNELCNAFSELNDPLDQEARFKEQAANKEAGDEESMPYDQDFVEALKHGMPPTAGLGMGIDRFVKLIVGAENLKEVILFPTLRPEK